MPKLIMVDGVDFNLNISSIIEGSGMNHEIYSGSIQDNKKVEICEVAVKKFLPKKFYFALYELINNSHIY